MTLPILLFLYGTHGNFLSRCLSVASGVEEDFDFYGSQNIAHNKCEVFTKVLYHTNPHKLSLNDGNDISVYISVDQSDFYILLWHIMLATHEFEVDILTIKDFDDIEKTLNQKSKSEFLKNINVDVFKNDGIRGLREFFKNLIKLAEKGFFEQQKDTLNRYNIKNIFKFAWFYDKNCFCEHVEKLLVNIGYDYKVDIAHHQQVFLDRKQNIIESKKLVELAFECYTSNTSMDISNFCLYEQSYLDFLIEQHLGYEIEIWQEYPTNTQDINPVEAWEGAKYEL